MNTTSQKAADIFSNCGATQVGVSVYKDEALLYAQVSSDTSEKLTKALKKIKTVDLVEDPGLSSDGLTWCWWLRCKENVKPCDWLTFIIPRIDMVVRMFLPKLLGQDNLKYNDNRQLDANRVELFVSIAENLGSPE